MHPQDPWTRPAGIDTLHPLGAARSAANAAQPGDRVSVHDIGWVLGGDRERMSLRSLADWPYILDESMEIVFLRSNTS